MFDDLLTDADRQYLRRVEDFCRDRVDPHTARWDDEENLPREIFTEAGRIGLLGMTVPAELGGRGMTYVAYARALMVLGRHNAALAMDVAAHNALSLGHIMAFGSDAQRRKYAPKLASGEWLGAWALTEPNAGSDTGAVESVAVQAGGDKWELTGRKMFITQGRRSDLLVVMARTGRPTDARPEISAFVVHAQHRQVVRKIYTYGMKSSDTAELRFDRAPAELVGERGKGRENALSLLDRGRIGIAALAVGVGRAAHETAAAYSLRRKQFARPVSDFQAVQWMLADSAVELDAAELLVLRAAAYEDAGRKNSREASAAKLFASEAATRACNKAVQVLGGRGVSRDHPVERYLRDAKICEIVEGTSEVQRLIVARHVLKDAQAFIPPAAPAVPPVAPAA